MIATFKELLADLLPKKNRFLHILLFFSMVAGWPCTFYLMGWLPDYKISYLVLFAVCGVVTLSQGSIKLPRPILTIFIVQIVAWLLFSAIHQDSSYITRIVYLCTAMMLVNFQANKVEMGFVKQYNSWIALQVILSAIGFVLVLVGLLQPFSQFVEMDGRQGYFFGLFTTNTWTDGFLRPAGFYDEPGALAFWGFFALIFNKLFVDDKRMEKLLMFGLIVTLSMAYFIQIAMYVLLFFERQRKKATGYIMIFLVAISAVGAISSDFNNAIFGRFEWNEETGTLQGNNRQGATERCVAIWKDYPIMGVGASNLASPEIMEEYGFVGANPYMNLAADGIVGACIAWLPLFYLIFGLGKKDKRYRYAGYVIAVSFLQRPYTDTQILYPIVMYTLILQGFLSSRTQFGKYEATVY